MTQEDIDRGLVLKEEIGNLDYFLITMKGNRNKTETDYSPKAWIKIKRTFSIFGSRYFRIGSHNQEIKVPYSLIDDLYELADTRKTELEKEFDELGTKEK